MELTKEEKQYRRMIETPVKRLVLTLAVPTTISMLITSIYNIADTMFVSHLSVAASGGVGVAYPIMAIIQAFGFMFGMGASSNISAKLGRKQVEEAKSIGATAFYSALAVGLLITIIGLLFLNPIINVLGATEGVFPHAASYARYILMGAPIMAASFVLNNILRGEGKAKFAMIGIVTGAILNIGLDPLFIYTFNLGTAGAAIATIISQLVSFSILISFFISKKAIMSLNPKYIAKKGGTYLEIIKVGLPSLARQGLASLATILLNNQAAIYGSDAALSAMGIVSKVYMVVFAMVLGIGQGYQPVCGYNYSAEHYERVKEACVFTYLTSVIAMALACCILFIFSRQVMQIFIQDEDTINIGIYALRFRCIALPLIAMNVIDNMTFQAIRKKFLALFLSCLNQGLFFIPLVFILPYFFGINGVELVQAGADVLTFLVSIPFFIYIIKHLNAKMKSKTLKLAKD
ncbi:MAG: MATE family efflux transporter [Bacilli bacterium]|jgi:putative MATE family efflux protein|nr:MATE family efflux transporter [Bacilli bacterium]MDD4066173.1 MATE family efflux transporter [Bacilli bacterium]